MSGLEGGISGNLGISRNEKISKKNYKPKEDITQKTQNFMMQSQESISKCEPKSFSLFEPIKTPFDILTKKSEKSSCVSQTSNTSGMTPTAMKLLNAMNKYPETKATPEQRKEIAIVLDKVCKEFGINPKLALAVFAHESKFDPNAKSSTGARGLGQITGSAIDENLRLANLGKSPYKENIKTFEAAKKNRTNITTNIINSVACLKDKLSDSKNNIPLALKRYGDPNIATYANLVNEASVKLGFGKAFL